MRNRILCAVALLVCAAGGTAAQEKGLIPVPSTPVPSSLQIQVVVSHHVGDKRVSSLPFSLSLNSTPGSRANVRLNGDVPMPTTVFAPVSPSDGKPPSPLTSFSYKSVGTNIDVATAPSVEGRYGLTITVSETSVRAAEAADAGGAKPPLPVTQNYQSSNTVQLKDGETTQFTAATDRVTGEVVRVEVTLKVLK